MQAELSSQIQRLVGDRAAADRSTGKKTISVNNPDWAGRAEEIEADYDSTPLDIGLDARYLLASSANWHPTPRSSASPTLIQVRDGAPALYMLMPLGVRR